MSKILVFVPNTVTSDRRVIRHTASLMQAGHEVEIVGIITNDKTGEQAITDEQIPVTRLPWRAATYRKLFFLTIRHYFLKSVLVFAALALFGLFLARPVFSWMVDNAPLLVVRDYIIPAVIVALGGVVLLISLGAFTVFLFEKLRIFIRRRKGMSNIAKAGKIAENYAKLETSGPEPLIFKILRWLEGKKTQNEDLLFKATVKARIKVMIEYGLEWNPDIAYCHEAACLPVGKKLKEKLGCKLIYDAHEIYDDLANATDAHSETYQAIHRQCFASVDHFITVNPRILDFYLKNYDNIKNYTKYAHHVCLHQSGSTYLHRPAA